MTALDESLAALLAESDLPDDPVLGDLLTELAALADGPVPAPSPELAALLPAARPGRRHRRRGVLIGALVVISLGTGATAAAADPDLRAGAVGAVSAVVHAVQPKAEHRSVQQRTPVPAPSVLQRTRATTAPRITATPVPAPASARPTPGPRSTHASPHALHVGGPIPGIGSERRKDGSSTGLGEGAGERDHGSSGSLRPLPRVTGLPGAAHTEHTGNGEVTVHGGSDSASSGRRTDG